MIRKYFTSTCCGLLMATIFAVVPVQAQNNPAPDNTRVNKQDRDQSQPTADQGKNNLSDREMASHIRRDVVKDKSLSTYGHNVKIVADHGKVTLKGPVHSEDEKRTIEDHARKYAGDGNVNDEMTVKGDKSSR
ncbi:MAG: BON domain-containing protein [Acidobacteriaceae bacterium]|nr:BON domain-containing protein [Acidobacteriaceae bacterium]MBV8571870.1 BON domain-containing protein [Acidobacteriaceae bacterium]